MTPIFIEPWDFIEEYGPNNKAAIEEEARKEISPEHPLYGKSLTAIARRGDCDDVLFEIDGGPAVACVHLTWSGKQESLGYPSTVIYESLEMFCSKDMIEDAKEY